MKHDPTMPGPTIRLEHDGPLIVSGLTNFSNSRGEPIAAGAFFGAAVQLMQTMARACGRDHLGRFERDDIATWHREMADLTGIDHAGSAVRRS